MNARLTLKVIQQGQAQKNFAIAPNAGQNGQALVLQASRGARYQLTDALTFTSPEKLQIKRVGADLLIALPGNDVGSPDVVIRGFFDAEGVSLSGLAPTGEPMLYDTDTSLLASVKGTGNAPINGSTVRPDQTLPVGLAKNAGGWFDSGWSLAAMVGGGVVLASAGGGSDGGGSSTSTSSGLSKITTYKADPSKPVPTVADFQDAGVTGVDNTNLTGILSVMPTTQLPLNSAASVQTLVNAFNKVLSEANGSAPDATPGSDPALTDYVNLLGTSAPATLSRKPAALSLLNDRIKALNASEIDTLTKMRPLTNAVDALAKLAEAASTTNLSNDQLTLLGVAATAPSTAAVTETTRLGAISDAIRQAPDDMSTLGTVVQLNTLVRAYYTILLEANGTGPDTTVANPSVEDYAAIHANIGAARTDAAALDRLNAIVGNLTTAGVDTVDEINQLAATLDKVLSVAQLATGTSLSEAQKLSVDELKNLGLSGFGGSEIQNTALALRFSEAVRDKDASEVVKGSLTGTRLVDGQPTAIDQTQLERLQALLSFEMIRGHRVDTTSSGTTTALPVPSVSDWQNLGVFRAVAEGSGKFQAVSASDTSALNDAVSTLRKPGNAAADALVNTPDKVRAVAQSYLGILSEANGTASNFASDGSTDLNPNPAWADYLQIGVTRKDGSATENTPLTKLINTVVAEKVNAQVDTIKELQNLVNVAEELLALSGTANSLSLDKLANNLTNPTSGSDGLGLQGITSKDLADVNGAIRSKSAGDLDTLGELQSLVSLVRIKRYADNSSDNDTPTKLDWAALRLSTSAADGEDMANDKADNTTYLNAYNSAAEAFTGTDLSGVGSSATDTRTGSLQALVNSYNKIIAKANGDDPDSVDSAQIGTADYANVGVNLGALWTESIYATPTIRANAQTLLNDTVGRLSSSVDSVNELVALAGTVNLLTRQAVKPDNVVTPQSTLNNTGPGGSFSNDLGLTIGDLNRMGLNTSKLNNFTNDSNDLNNVWAAVQNMDAATLTYKMIQDAITQYAN